MPDFETAVDFTQFKGFAETVDALHVQFKPYLPSVHIECPLASPEPVDLYVGSWDGTNFVETLVKTLHPGEIFNRKLVSVDEFSNFHTGQSLMVRVRKSVGIYTLKNLETYFGYALTVAPPVYPWWKPNAAPVRWGPEHPYLVHASDTLYSYIIPEWEDVFYYYRIS